jgi:hypothetical protein
MSGIQSVANIPGVSMLKGDCARESPTRASKAAAVAERDFVEDGMVKTWG